MFVCLFTHVTCTCTCTYSGTYVCHVYTYIRTYSSTCVIRTYSCTNVRCTYIQLYKCEMYVHTVVHVSYVRTYSCTNVRCTYINYLLSLIRTPCVVRMRSIYHHSTKVDRDLFRHLISHSHQWTQGPRPLNHTHQWTQGPHPPNHTHLPRLCLL